MGLNLRPNIARLAPALTAISSADPVKGGVFSVVVGLCDDLHVLIEGDEEAQEAPHAVPERSIDAPRRLRPFLKTGL
jgi:hypothetical protein